MRYGSDPWGDLRAMRADPPGHAGPQKARKKVFLAALEQCEQLLRGAQTLGYASRPLNLFYGLSQAGRAVSAAWCRPDADARNAWRLSGHGISAKGLNQPIERIAVVGENGSHLNGRDAARPSFTALASVLGSDYLTRPANLIDLWACLPEAIGRPAPGDDARWGPLQIEDPVVAAEDREIIVGAVTAWTHNWPVDQLRSWETFGGRAFNDRVHRAILTRYPSMSPPATAAMEAAWPTQWLGRRGSICLTWDVGPDTPYLEAAWQLQLYATAYRGEHWVFPTVEAQRLHPFITWLSVLFTLSMLARYEPERWVDVIDVDRSVWATPVEHLLDEAITALPALISETLSYEPLALE